MPQVGNRVYHQIERKRAKRTAKRANKGLPTKARRVSVRDRNMALRFKGLI